MLIFRAWAACGQIENISAWGGGKGGNLTTDQRPVSTLEITASCESRYFGHGGENAHFQQRAEVKR